jgi:Bacterial Ig-like domain (group 3)
VAPGGTVDLLVDGSVLGSATVQVVNGVAEAVFTVEFFGTGSFTFSAQYLGSSQFQGSTSNAVTVNVF